LLEGAGYRVHIAPHALDSTGYLAGPDECRAADLQSAFDDPEVAAIFCARGGYGCARLFPYIDLDRMSQSRKLFVGFSDITTLHVALNRRGMPTIHGPMPLTLHFPRVPYVYDSLLRSLSGDLTPPPEAPRACTVTGGESVGVTAGGCLCLLCDTLGTPEALNTDGKIVFIEDVDEAPHRVDGMFTHLLNCGQLKNAAGIVVGEMTRSDERPDQYIGAKPWREIVVERIGDLGVPAVIDYPFGHFKSMVTVGLGLRARLDANEGVVTYEESLCAD
jgi:muramoyltetrapeptide carboxypeptidase